MVILLRRFCCFLMLGYWQGGFLFYSSVVVPLGTKILGGPKEQGAITQQVTDYLNLVGGVALAFLCWETLALSWHHSLSSRCWKWLQRVSFLTLLITWFVLLYLHPLMDTLLEEGETGHFQRQLFRPLHRRYLWVSTIQWGASLLFMLASVALWKSTPNSNSAKSKTPELNVQ